MFCIIWQTPWFPSGSHVRTADSALSAQAGQLCVCLVAGSANNLSSTRPSVKTSLRLQSFVSQQLQQFRRYRSVTKKLTDLSTITFPSPLRTLNP